MLFSSIIGYFLINTYYQFIIKEENDEKNVAIAQELTDYIETTEIVDLEDYLSTLGEIGYQLYVVDEFGDSQFFGGEFKDIELPLSVQKTVLGGQVYHGMKDYPSQSFMTGLFSNELINTVGVPFKYQENRYGLFFRPNIQLLFSKAHTIIVGLMMSTALISLIVVLFVAKRLIRPITQLTEATKQITQENFNLPLSINRQDEIGQLTESFNKMMKQLQENDRSRKEFISNVSHDFQSPLLNIQGYADLLKSPSITEEERFSFTSIIETETKRLSNLTKQLLLLTSLDQSTRRLNRESFDLEQLIKSIGQKYLWLIEDLGIELYYKTTPIKYYGDQSMIESALDNLFTNALKYNKQNGLIQIALVELEWGIQIEIQNDGIGIKDIEIPHLFERFYRADSSRTEEGTGLGLAIVKQVVDLHGGTIQVSSVHGEGTSFLIMLPNLQDK